MTSLFAVFHYPHVNPVMFKIGPITVRWYGFAYLTGFALAYVVLRRMIRKGQLMCSESGLTDLFTWLIVGVFLGGRLGWYFVYHRSTGAPQPWYEPFAIWHGGMSFHGGLVGVMLALAIWTRVNKMRFWNIADCLALVTPIGLFFGRIANFINAELVGRRTDMPWGVVFPADTFARHPSQLYEAVLEGPLLFLALWLVWRKRPAEGQVSAIFLLCYGVFRILVEFTRQPDPEIGFIAFGWLTMGQLLSALIVIAGLWLWTARRSARKHSPELVTKSPT